MEFGFEFWVEAEPRPKPPEPEPGMTDEEIAAIAAEKARIEAEI